MQNNYGKASKTASIVIAVTIAVNFALCAVKLTAGIVGNSYAMISDAINSAADVISSLIMLVGIRLAAKKADKNHPYGHERFECVASLVLAFIMMITAFEVGKAAATGQNGAAPDVIALIAAAVTICVKAALFAVTLVLHKKSGSAALKNLSLDHIGDVIATTGGLVGIVLARSGYPLFDRLAGALICVLIAVTAVRIFRGEIAKLTDEAVDEQTENELNSAVLSDSGVSAIDRLVTRRFGDRIYVDMEIAVRGDLSLVEAHEIAERVHDMIERDFPSVKHCTVHVNPSFDSAEE